MEKFVNTRYGISSPIKDEVKIVCDFYGKEINSFYSTVGKLFCDLKCANKYNMLVRGVK